MNIETNTLLSVRSKFFQMLLLGIVSLIAGFMIFWFSKISCAMIILAEVTLLGAIIASLTRNIKRVLMALLLITIPINIDKSFFFNAKCIGGVPGLVVSAWSLMLISLYFVWFFEHWMGKKQKINFPPFVSISLGFLLLFSVLSMAKSDSLALSFFQIVELVKVYLLIFYIANNIHTEKDYKFVLYILFATLFFEVCLAYYQHIANSYIDLGILADGKARKARELGNTTLMGVSGTFFGDGPFSDYLVLLLSLLIAVIINKGKTFTKIIYLSLFAVSLPILVFTFSRGGWLGFVVAIIFFIIVKAIFSLKKPLALINILVFVFVALTVIYFYRDILFHRIYGDDHGSALGRIPMMQIGFEMIKANPFLGVGINNYATTMALYDPTGLSYVWYQPVHNVLIQLTAEIGIPGFLSLISFLLALLVYAFKYMKRSTEFFQNQLIGLVAGILGLFVHGMVNNAIITTMPFLFTWLFGGLILSIAQVDQQKTN